MNTDTLKGLLAIARVNIILLEAELSKLDRSIAAAETEKLNTGLACPLCGTGLSDANDITTMGAVRAQYACPNCDFRGAVLGGVK